MLADVEARSRIAVTVGGRRISFDALVVATGAVPGVPFPGALTFRGRDDVPVLRGLLHDLTSGRAGSVALALPSERMWPLPLYELALMTAAHLNEHGAGDVKVTLVTPEEVPLELFGPAATDAVRSLLEARRITVRSSSLPAVARGRVLLLAGGAEVFADRVITLPVLEGPALRTPPRPARLHPGRQVRTGQRRLTTSLPRATSPRSRSSREVSPLNRPTPSRERSPRWPARPSRPSRSARCCADSCSRAARRCTCARSRSGSRARRRSRSKHPGPTGPRATPRRPPGRRCGGLRRRSPASTWLHTSPRPGHRRSAPACSPTVSRSRPAGVRRRVGGRACAHAAARRLRRALGRFRVGPECARRGRSAQGALPPEYEAKRHQWRAEARLANR